MVAKAGSRQRAVPYLEQREEGIRTVRPRGLLVRPEREERPPLCVEEEVALERSDALEHRRELVRVARAERRALCGVIRVEGEEGRDFLARRAGKVQVAQVVEEFSIGAVEVKRTRERQ